MATLSVFSRQQMNHLQNWEKKLNISDTIQPILAKSTQMIPVCLAILILVIEDLGNIRQGQMY